MEIGFALPGISTESIAPKPTTTTFAGLTLPDNLHLDPMDSSPHVLLVVAGAG